MVRCGCSRTRTATAGFDRSTIYAGDLAWPTAIVCYDGGVFIGATPDILFLKDTDGDQKADERRVIFTGIGDGVNRLNMQSLMNSFRWGHDNRIHGTASGTPGKVRVVGKPERGTVSFRRGDFSFDPRVPDFRLESGGAQQGWISMLLDGSLSAATATTFSR
ncbi:MAG: hypothetical protein CM1200mP29_03930 [Verrucomicrobiota bacterium]|nr:MAG: hypothetical protein CM1200mP29_03930 [Verrucomicrobiota bacterium]